MTGVILINFGGPRSEEEIKPFLEDIFKDVLPLPLKPFAPLLARIREMRSKRMYAEIGGASPVVGWTRLQAVLLQKRLGKEYHVYAGMIYGRPSIEDAIEDAKSDGCKEILQLQLFPYQFKPANGQTGKPANRPWHLHPLYIQVMVSIIRPAITKDAHLIFSAHATFKSAAKKSGYVKQINESIAKIMEHFEGHSWHLAFQSAPFKLGWTGPDVKTVLKKIPTHLEPTHLLIIPFGFACENLETLYEIDKVYIPYAQKSGLVLTRTPALNDNPQFIDLLAKLVLENPQT